MAKKLSSFILAFLLLLSIASAAAEESDARLGLLSALGILEGYEDGTYRLDNVLTRAEFTKISVCASEHRKTVSAALATSPFSDVPHTLWSAPYIQLAAKSGYVSGYLDSTFRPDATITYAEATAVFLRLLGYENRDFGTAWPRGHMEIAESIGLCDGLALDYAAPMTRLDTVQLLCNLLDETCKGSQTKYLSLLECSSFENAVIQATSAEDTAIAQSRVLTSAGTFKKGNLDFSNFVGLTGKLYIKDGDTVVAFLPKEQTIRTFSVTGIAGGDLLLDDAIYNLDDNLSVYYKSAVTTYGKLAAEAKTGASFSLFYDEDGSLSYGLLRKNTVTPETLTVRTVPVYTVMGDGVITYQNGRTEKIPLSDGVPLYENDVLSGTLSKARLKMGDILKIVYTESGDVDYVILDTDGVDGPFTVSGDAWHAAFPITDATTVMRDGQKVSLSEIESGDVVYYSSALDMVLTYTDKITGVYQSAAPSKDVPSTVCISGTNYTIESLTAFQKLSSGGDFSFGDTVTLLLGRGGEVADVWSAAAGDMVGVVTAAGTAPYETTLGETYTGYMLSITDASGNVYSYEAAADYASYLNSVVSLSFVDGLAKVKPAASDSLSGTVNSAARTIGSNSLSPSVKIIEVYAPDAYMGGMVAPVFLQRLDGVTLQKRQVLYVGRDRQNRIDALILTDITGDLHRYGIVTKATSSASEMSSFGTYQYIIDGQTGVLQTSGSSFSIGSGAPARFSYSGGKIHAISRLTEMTGRVQAIGDGVIRYADGKSYAIHDAAIYTKDSSFTYIQKKAEDIDLSTYHLRAYYDKAPSEGGKIRIILATK